MPRQPQPAPGYATDVSDLVHDLAMALVDQVTAHKQAAGPPWRSTHLTQRQAVARTDQYDTPQPSPEVARYLEQLPKGQLVQAALEAVRLRKRALASGQWAPSAGHPLAVSGAAGMAYGAPEPIPGLHNALAQHGRAPNAPLPVRELIGGQRVPAGAAAMSRQITAPGLPPTPPTPQELQRGSVVPGPA